MFAIFTPSREDGEHFMQSRFEIIFLFYFLGYFRVVVGSAVLMPTLGVPSDSGYGCMNASIFLCALLYVSK